MRTLRRAGAFLCIVLLTVGVTLTGCHKQSVKLESKDSGGQATLSVGETVTITLKSNRTTGFGWEIVGLEDQDALALVEQSYKADSALIGAGGADTITLKAVKAGEVQLELSYRRAWETDVAPLETFTYDLVIR